MRQPQTIFALDLGTTKFCLAKYDVAMNTNIELVSIPARGMERGMLSNLSEAKAGLCALIEKAEETFNEDVLEISVGIAGSHIKSKHEYLGINITSGRVQGADIDTLMQLAQEKFLENDREVLHLIPIQYDLDGRIFADEPINFSGKKLTIRYLKIDGNEHYLQDVMTLCNQSGLKVRRFIAEPVASASVTLTDDQKRNGVMVLDIGGGTSDGLIFLDNKPWHCFTVNIAGKMMTRDLMIGLGVEVETAEKIKHKIGLQTRDNQNILVQTKHNKLKRIFWKDVYPILGARIKELSVQINKNLDVYSNKLSCGLTLTGGGSGILDVEKLIEKTTFLYTSKASPVFQSESTEEQFEPKYATVVGLINMDIGELVQNKNTFKKSKASRYLTQFVNWLKELS